MAEQLDINYIGSLYGHNGIVTSIAVGQDKNGAPLVVSGSRDKRIIVWKLDLENPEAVPTKDEKESTEKICGKPYRALSGHNHFVSSLSISADSTHVISGSWDKTIRLWDLTKFTTKKLLKGHTKDILSVAFTKDSRYIVSGSMDNSLRVWNINGEEKFNLNDFNGWVSCIHQFENEKEGLFAVGSQDLSVKFYDKNFQQIAESRDFEYPVVSVGTDEEGNYIFAGEKNGIIKVFKYENKTLTKKSSLDVNADINAISFESKHYLSIFSATSKGLLVNDVSKVNKVLYQKDTCGCHSLAWDEKKNYLFAGFADGVIRVFKVQS